MTKVFTIVLAPIGLFTLTTRNQRLSYVTSSVLSAGLVILLPLVTAPQYVLAWLRTMTNCSSWETIWSLLEGYQAYGVVAPLGVRMDPGTSAYAVHPSNLPWSLISLAFAAVYVLLLSRRINWRDMV